MELKNYQFDTNYHQLQQQNQFRSNMVIEVNEEQSKNTARIKKDAKEIKLKCEECMITYSSKKRYDNHIEKHHTKKCLHKCMYCRSSFKRRVKLINHYSKTHPEFFQEDEVQQKQPINFKMKPSSIFHNIEILAQSDSNDSSSSSAWQI